MQKITRSIRKQIVRIVPDVLHRRGFVLDGRTFEGKMPFRRLKICRHATSDVPATRNRRQIIDVLENAGLVQCLERTETERGGANASPGKRQADYVCVIVWTKNFLAC